MRRINRAKRKVNAKDYIRRSATDRDFDELLTEPCVIGDDIGVRVIYDYLDGDGPVNALRKIKCQIGKRISGLKTRSRTFGYSPRVSFKHDYCYLSGLATDQPIEHDAVARYGEIISKIYQRYAPSEYGIHMEEVRHKVRKDWRIPNTPFTSGIINKNSPLKYHFDAGNFKGKFSCMIAFKRDVVGGYLSLPEYGIGLEIRDRSVLIFDGQTILHGVTPIRLLSPTAYRLTAVYYSLQGMWKCQTVTEEVARIRNRKTERERRRAEGNEAIRRQVSADV
jgi:hypothetical protein